MATKRVKNPESLDAIDIALARAVDSDEARALLEKQARLIDSQETLARADLRHRGWQIIGERVAALLKALTVLVGMALILGIVLFFWSAKQASGMVMDPFSVPPAMDRQGLTGSVVAQQLLDKVAALEAGTQSSRASSSYENSWGDSKGVAVPYTGVSLGQLRREARDWLGSERHLSGDVVQLPDGRIAISFRNGQSAGRVEGAANDFNALLDQAALLIFKETQPYRHGVWLSRNGGTKAELRAIFTKLTRSPDPRERLWGLHGLATVAPDSEAESVALYRRALAADPKFLSAIGNLPFYADRAGRDEEAYQLSQKSAVAYMAGQADYTPSHATSYGMSSQARVADYRGDTLRAAQILSDSVAYTADARNTAARPFEAAEAWSWAHDFAAAKEELAAAGYADAARRAAVEQMIGMQESERLLLARATDDYAVIADELVAMIAHELKNAKEATDLWDRQAFVLAAASMRPEAAVTLARARRIDEARAILRPMPANHDGALRARAFVAAVARDPAAESLFAHADVRIPSLPAARLLWAEAAQRTGKYAAAEAHAREAIRRGPNSAEAHFLLGEALLAQAKVKAAVAAFEAAAKHAPRWGRVQIKLTTARWMAGDRKAAVDALRAAQGMTLNPRDRVKLGAMIREVNRKLAAA